MVNMGPEKLEERQVVEREEPWEVEELYEGQR
jgi:hypothetical protein